MQERKPQVQKSYTVSFCSKMVSKLSPRPPRPNQVPQKQRIIQAAGNVGHASFKEVLQPFLLFEKAKEWPYSAQDLDYQKENLPISANRLELDQELRAKTTNLKQDSFCVYGTKSASRDLGAGNNQPTGDKGVFVPRPHLKGLGGIPKPPSFRHIDSQNTVATENYPKESNGGSSVALPTPNSGFNSSNSFLIRRGSPGRRPSRELATGPYQHKMFGAMRQSSQPSANHSMMSRTNPIAKSESPSPKAGSASMLKQSSLKYKNFLEKNKSITAECELVKVLNDLPRVSAKSWVLLDSSTKEPLFGFKHGTRREVASLTKLVTLITACKLIEEHHISPNQMLVNVTFAAATKIGTTANLRPGDRLSLLDLLYGTMLPSGNDAAQAVCDALGVHCLKRVKNSDPELYKKLISRKDAMLGKYFVDEMNSLSELIGLTNSSFTNPHGLMNKLNQSTALDIALVITEGFRSYPLFKTVISTKSHTATVMRSGSPITMDWTNTHLLLEKQNFLGGKTGVTMTAGPCLATAYSIPNSKEAVVIVLLKCASMEDRFSETRELFDWATKHYTRLKKVPVSIRNVNL